MNELVVFDEVKATMTEYKAKNETLVFDYRDPEGNKEARSHIAKLRKVKTRISEIHKDAKADALAVCKALDGKKRELTGEVEEMISYHKDPLDAIEAEQQAKIDAERQRLEEEEAKRLADIEAREAAVREAEEKIAKEKAEAERIEREKRIAEDAAIGARERAEEKAKAEADAKELAERNRKEAEEVAEQKRITNKKHRQGIENAIEFSLTELGLNVDDANCVLTALKESRIPHVSINY